MFQANEGQDYSEIAKMLLPLLDALHWKGDENKLKQSMGGLEYEMTIDGLIDTMANLNFKHSRIRKVKGRSVDTRMLPLLLVSTDMCYLIIKMDDLHALVFNGQKEVFENVSVDLLYGDIYTFKYIGDLKDSLIHQQENWFTKLMLRFKKSYIRLTVLTFFISLLDLLIPMFVILIYDQIGSSADKRTLYLLLVGVVLYFAATISLDYLRMKITNYISARMGNIISHQTFRRLMYLPPSYTETASISSQINRIKDFENLKRFTNSGIFMNILELIFSVIYIIAIFVIGGWLGFIPIMTFLVVVILGILMRPFHKIKAEKTAQTRAEYNRTLMEILKNTQEIKSSGMKKHWQSRITEVSAENIYENYNLSSYVSSSNNLIYFVTNASVILVIYGGVLRIFDGLMSMGALIGIVLLYWRILSSIRGVTSLLVQVTGLKKSILQINRFMKLPQDTSLRANMILSKDIKGKVKFQDVSIRYSKTSKAALINTNFTVEPGTIMGISGHDGAGKTTILKLIMGMYLPQGGRIIIDNLNLKQLEPLTLRQSIAYSSEKDVIFTGSVRANFRHHNPLIEDKTIIELMNKTGLDKYMISFDYNLDTVFTEYMLDDLSPSFKKLFCLTRLLSRNVNLFLIDEPENHLDKIELDRIIAVLEYMAIEQKTIIVTSKSEDVLIRCHSVYELNQGRGKLR